MNHTVAQTRASIVTMVYNNLIGEKSYELSNHLGNVLEVTSDRKLLNINRSIPVLATQYSNNESAAAFSKTIQLLRQTCIGNSQPMR